MAAILPKRPIPRKRSRAYAPINYRITDRGRDYRLCATTDGRVLFCALKHKHSEQALTYGARTSRRIGRLVQEKFGVAIRWTVA